jgi:hypothetical protein
MTTRASVMPVAADTGKTNNEDEDSERRPTRRSKEKDEDDNGTETYAW